MAAAGTPLLGRLPAGAMTWTVTCCESFSWWIASSDIFLPSLSCENFWMMEFSLLTSAVFA